MGAVPKSRGLTTSACASRRPAASAAPWAGLLQNVGEECAAMSCQGMTAQGMTATGRTRGSTPRLLPATRITLRPSSCGAPGSPPG